MENNLPESWELVKLVEQINFLPTGVKEYSGTRKYYSTGSIQENVNTPEGEFTFKNRPSRANRISVKGDVFQARMKATDKGILVDDKLHDQLFSTGFIQLRPYGNTYDNKLLYYLIKSEQFLTQKNEYATGSTQEALTDTGASEIEIPLPPLAEQQRIVAKLDALFEKIESNKKRLEKIPVILKRFRQSVLAAAVSGKLTEDWREKNVFNDANDLISKIQEFRKEWVEQEVKKGNSEAKRVMSKLKKHSFNVLNGSIPKTWAYSSLLEACHLVVDCHNKTAPYAEDGIYLVRTTNIKDGKIILEDIRYVTQKTYEYWSKRSVPVEGDIIFTREAPMGEAAIIPIGMKVCLGQRTMLLKLPKNLLNNNFLLYCLMAPKMAEQINDKAIGSGVKHLRVGDVESLIVPIAPLEEQNVIVDKVKMLFALSDNLENRYYQTKKALDKLPQVILSKAFRGELVSQNPDDEPASVLLERIKEEKEKLKLVKKKKQK